MRLRIKALLITLCIFACGSGIVLISNTTPMREAAILLENKDISGAARWGKLWLGQWTSRGQLNLARTYYDGKLVPTSYSQSLLWFEKSAEKGNPEAQYALGRMYDLGEDVAENPQSATDWYQRAADQGDSAAQNSLGRHFEEGRGTTKNLTQAEKLYRVAASKGNADAQLNLGFLYFDGRAVPQDYMQAMQWFEKAAASGNIQATGMIGEMFLNGQGVATNLTKAVEYLSKSADAGFPGALYALGLIYNSNQDDPRFSPDIVLSYALLDLASAAGQKDAPGEKDRIAKLLTKEQFNDAQKIASAWKPGIRLPRQSSYEDLAPMELFYNTPKITPELIARTRVLHSVKLQAGDKKGHAVFLITKGADDCHACGATISVVTFWPDQYRKYSATVQAALTETGSYGDIVSPHSEDTSVADQAAVIEDIDLGVGKTGFLVSSTYSGMGITADSNELFIYDSKHWLDAGQITVHVDNKIDCNLRDENPIAFDANLVCYSWSGTISTKAHGPDKWPDIILKVSGTEQDQKTKKLKPAADETYRFDGKKYVSSSPKDY